MDKALKELVDESLKISVTADIHDLRRQGYPLAQPELGDRVFLIDERIGLDEEVRVVDISITRNWRGEVIDLNLTFGSEGITKRYQSNLSTAIKNITEVMAGRKKIPYSVLDNAVLQATKALQNAQTELKFTEQGILAIDKNNPNLVTILNSAGVGVSTDGGATFGQAITGYGINASYIVTGVLDAGQVVVRGGDSANYTHIQDSTMELRGNFNRTWMGETLNHDVRTRLHRGHLRFRNDSLERSLYFSEFGISTYIDGEGEIGGSSGTIEWWDTTYSPSGAKGITIMSHPGVVALRSNTSHVIIDSFQSADISSEDSVVYINPKTSQAGNNNFWFNLLDNSSDGFLMYGSRNSGAGAGLRFSKGSSVNTVSVVDGDYNRGGNTIFDVGTLRTNNIYKRESNTTVYWNGTSGGSTSIDVNPDVFRASGIRANVGSSDIFLATNDGAVRVTDGKGNNRGGVITYRPIAASSFNTPGSTSSINGLKSSRSNPPTDKEAIDLINEIDLLRYTVDGKPEFKAMSLGSPIKSDESDSVDLTKAVFYLIKSVQELSTDE